MTPRPPVDQAHRDRIHTELDATLFVEAGAGTGKTRELIERILRLIIAGRAELRGIAAITFTEAAAADLRDRVRERLEQALQDEAAHDDNERARCMEALRQVDAAAIETLHAFAQRILASHPIEAGLPPLIEVQDEIRASIAFQERWDDFFDALLEDPALEEPLVRAFSLGLKSTQLREVARRFHENWDRLEDLPKGDAHLPPIDVTLLIGALGEACGQMADCTNPEDKLYQHLQRVDAYRHRLERATTDIERLQVLAERTPIAAGNVGQKGNWRHGAEPVRDRLRQAEDIRAELLRAARTGVLPPILGALRRFVLDYADERRRQGRLEFHDLLVQCRDLLRRAPSVRRAVQQRFSHILIDEFQDTDPLQIEIAVLLAADPAHEADAWHEARVQDGRLFFVGDPKQSIYRFRRADIALYQRAQSLFAAGEVRLTQSFRSLPPLTEWVNGVIGPLMADDEGAGQAPYVDLHPYRAAPQDGAACVIILGGPSDAGNVAQLREREAREIAEAIMTIKADGWTVFEREDEGERARPARYQDIALLIPTRTSLPPIEHALEQAGIPYRIESQSLVYSTQEVQDLLSILRCIDDPTDEVALIAALRSPAFACADDELLAYRRAGGRWDYRLDPPRTLPANHPVIAGMLALRELHHRRWWEPISGVVEAVIRERRLFELAFAHRRPREHWQRLRFVLDQARAFAEAGGATLRQFIDWAERQKEEGTRVVETVVPEPDDDAVRIMTIHAAKGLEFPIVLLAGLNIEQRNTDNDEACIVLWSEDGRPEVRIGGKDGFATPGYDELAAREQELERQEKVRLLYVAATRARDHLIVSLHHKRGVSCHAQELYQRCAFAPELWQPFQRRSAPPSERHRPAPFDDSSEQRAAWLQARAERIVALARAPVRSATELARGAARGVDDPNVRKEAPAEELPPWRRGRAGTAFGRAVHAVLQSIDLASGKGVESAAQAQAAAEGIAARADDVARAVRAALGSNAVREAMASGRYWRELYVAAPVDGVTVEGFVDLLYEAPEGLVIIDYKTDLVPHEEDLEQALERYRLQGAAYALALERALGRPVARCAFVFAQPGRVIERTLDDLPAAIEEVRARLATST